MISVRWASSSTVHRVGSPEFGGKAAAVGVVGRERQSAGDDLLREAGALLALQEAGGEVAVFGEAGGKFVGAGGALGVVARRGKRDVVVRLGEQAGK